MTGSGPACSHLHGNRHPRLNPRLDRGVYARPKDRDDQREAHLRNDADEFVPVDRGNLAAPPVALDRTATSSLDAGSDVARYQEVDGSRIEKCYKLAQEEKT